MSPTSCYYTEDEVTLIEFQGREKENTWALDDIAESACPEAHAIFELSVNWDYSFFTVLVSWNLDYCSLQPKPS